MQNTYNTLYCIFYVFVCLTPHPVVTVTKFWICGMHNVCVYVYFYSETVAH
jgi:hypothetical protein